MYTLHITRFCMFDADLYAQSVFINKISASELSQKFIKIALLVGHRRVARHHLLTNKTMMVLWDHQFCPKFCVVREVDFTRVGIGEQGEGMSEEEGGLFAGEA